MLRAAARFDGKEEYIMQVIVGSDYPYQYSPPNHNAILQTVRKHPTRRLPASGLHCTE